MNNQPDPTIRSGEQISYLDSSNAYLIFSLEFWNKIIATCRAVLNTRDWRVSEKGILVDTPAATAAASTTSAFAITELGHQDYFVARQLSNVRIDGGAPTADVGGTDIKIAKAKIVRRSIVAESLFGDPITYSDDDPTDIDNTRNADNGTDPTESQVCLPPYLTMTALGLADTVPMNCQCVVYAEKLTGLTGVFDEDGKQLDWIEDAGKSGARVFAKRFSS